MDVIITTFDIKTADLTSSTHCAKYERRGIQNFIVRFEQTDGNENGAWWPRLHAVNFALYVKPTAFNFKRAPFT
jgi:hypothetical protein